MRPKGRSADQEVARVAGAQHGVITRTQLLAAGVSPGGIKRRAAKGVLHRELRGVYRVGHRAPSVEAHYLAAILACGEGAALSGRAAAFHYGLIRGPAPPPEVTVSAGLRVHGVRTRRVRRIERMETTVHRSVPITTVARTLLDLAAELPLEDLARVCHEAEVRYHVDASAIARVAARHPRSPGIAKLREIFTGQVSVTLSILERRFLDVLRGNGLPLPVTNRRAHGRYVDCRWAAHRLTVELDSYRFHHSRHAWEQDRRREREARSHGDEFRRYTYRDVVEDRTFMLAELRELLAARSTNAARLPPRTAR